jgi:acetyl/propionyl-CoA carboxylase alpha subunit
MPAGPGVRVDTGIEAGDRVPAEYDNLIAKILVHAGDRDAAIARLRRALDETEIAGIQTTLPFHRFVSRSEPFRTGELSTGWVGEWWDGPAEFRRAARVAMLAAGLDALERGHAIALEGQPTGSSGDDGSAGDGRWRRSSRAAATDRWPS